MTRNFLTAFSMVAITAACAWAQAAPPQKLAVIDMQSALISTKDGQKAIADLRAKYTPRDQDFQKRQQALQAKQDEYRRTQNTISEEAKSKLERDIDTQTRSLQRDADDAKQDMDQDQQRLLQDLGGKMMQVLTKYATDNHISLVFDVSGEPNNLRFASTAIDITRDVIAMYDKAAPVTPTAPPSTTAAPTKPAPNAATSAPRTPGPSVAPPK